MAELFSKYTSGLQFTAGTIIGSAAGASGINPIVDRLNSISTENNFICGSLISGTNLDIYAGSIIMNSGLFVIEGRTSDPANVAVGRMWVRTDL